MIGAGGLSFTPYTMLFLAIIWNTSLMMSKTPACIVAFYVTGCTKKSERVILLGTTKEKRRLAR